MHNCSGQRVLQNFGRKDVARRNITKMKKNYSGRKVTDVAQDGDVGRLIEKKKFVSDDDRGPFEEWRMRCARSKTERKANQTAKLKKGQKERTFRTEPN